MCNKITFPTSGKEAKAPLKLSINITIKQEMVGFIPTQRQVTPQLVSSACVRGKKMGSSSWTLSLTMHSSYRGPNLAQTIENSMLSILYISYFFWHKNSNFLYVMAVLQTKQDIKRKSICLQCTSVIETNREGRSCIWWLFKLSSQ